MTSFRIIAVARSRAELVFGALGTTLEAKTVARAVVDTVQVGIVACKDLLRVFDRI